MSGSAPAPFERTSWRAEALRCRACGGGDVRVFYEVAGVPTNSVLLLRTREEALACARGDVRLGFCPTCGFVCNVAFDATLTRYCGDYEETQGFSDTFNAFHRRLAEHLVEGHDLRGKRIVEIGCGKGEFLSLLCETGDNEGVGFDPAYLETRRPHAHAGKVRFVADFFSERYAGERADLVCCKMTLEHVAEPVELLRTIRRTIHHDPATVVFLQVPDARRILDDGAFWDVYYEHCSYFTAGSLARLLDAAGYRVDDVSVDYGGQYLLAEARPFAARAAYTATANDGNGHGEASSDAAVGEPMHESALLVERFAARAAEGRARWRERLDAWRHDAKRVVLWGAGSKAVSFLTTLDVGGEVERCVDVNPHKHGTFTAGTGHEIVAPQRLVEDPPDVVVVMNPIYREEIAEALARLGLAPEMLSV